MRNCSVDDVLVRFSFMVGSAQWNLKKTFRLFSGMAVVVRNGGKFRAPHCRLPVTARYETASTAIEVQKRIQKKKKGQIGSRECSLTSFFCPSFTSTPEKERLRFHVRVQFSGCPMTEREESWQKLCVTLLFIYLEGKMSRFTKQPKSTSTIDSRATRSVTKKKNTRIEIERPLDFIFYANLEDKMKLVRKIYNGWAERTSTNGSVWHRVTRTQKAARLWRLRRMDDRWRWSRRAAAVSPSRIS